MYPSLAKLNNEMFLWQSSEQDQVLSDIDQYIIHEVFPSSVVAIPAPKPAPPAPVVPDIGTLSASLISSDDKLFFISHAPPGSSNREWSLVRVAL